jgi:hypothetical protein
MISGTEPREEVAMKKSLHRFATRNSIALIICLLSMTALVASGSAGSTDVIANQQAARPQKGLTKTTPAAFPAAFSPLVPLAPTITALVASSPSVTSDPGASGNGRQGPALNLRGVVDAPVVYSGDAALVTALQTGSARARALASADLDRDGATDLIAGYARDGIGIVTVQRGNTDAFAPKDEAVFERLQKGYNPQSLVPVAESYEAPEPVDFLQVGDFNQDAQKDILLAARGGGLYLLAGDGKGGLDKPEKIKLPGTVTVMTAGEFNAADGRTDVAVGIAGADGPALLIFQQPTGALHSGALSFPLESEATAVQFGGLDDSWTSR